MKINYDSVIELLNFESENISKKLQVKNTKDLLNRKKDIDYAIKWLKKGMDNQINPNSDIIKIPETITKTACSEFRLIEDHESDKKEHWTEVKINNKELRPLTGDFLIMK